MEFQFVMKLSSMIVSGIFLERPETPGINASMKLFMFHLRRGGLKPVLEAAAGPPQVRLSFEFLQLCQSEESPTTRSRGHRI